MIQDKITSNRFLLVFGTDQKERVGMGMEGMRYNEHSSP